MKIFVQWSTLDPEDWQEIDSSDWINLPQGPVPSNHNLSNEKLWVHALNVQGIVFMSFDHYAVEDIENSHHSPPGRDRDGVGDEGLPGGEVECYDVLDEHADGEPLPGAGEGGD